MTAQTSLLERRGLATLAVVGLCVLCGVLPVVTGNGVLGLAIPLAIFGALVFFRLPLGAKLVCVFIFGILADDPAENPGMGVFKTPLAWPGEVLYTALEKTLGVPGLKMYGMELLFMLVGVLVYWRARGRRFVETPALYAEGKRTWRSSPAFVWGCWSAIFGLGVMFLWGTLRGGPLRFSLLQARALLFVFVIALVLAPTFNHRRYIHVVLGSIVGLAFVRSLMGIYYWLAILQFEMFGETESGSGTYVLTHSDAFLDAIALLIVVLALLMRPSVRTFLLALVTIPPIMYFIVVNNRRLALVELVAGLFAVYFLADKKLRRLVHRIAFAMLPFLLVYVAAGWNSTARWAAPVQSLRSVSSSSDTSSQTRDIENYNLILTLKPNPILGQGLGHEYNEVVRAWSIADKFEAYLYVPHNSLLWLWTAGGWVGFTLVWIFFVCCAFLAYRLARGGINGLGAAGQAESGMAEKMLAYVAVGTTAAFAMQAFGDMGLQSWMVTLITGSVMALLGANAERVEPWYATPVPDLEAEVRVAEPPHAEHVEATVEPKRGAGEAVTALERRRRPRGNGEGEA